MKVTTEGTLSGFQEFFLQPIIKDRPKNGTLSNRLGQTQRVILGSRSNSEPFRLSKGFFGNSHPIITVLMNLWFCPDCVKWLRKCHIGYLKSWYNKIESIKQDNSLYHHGWPTSRTPIVQKWANLPLKRRICKLEEKLLGIFCDI